MQSKIVQASIDLHRENSDITFETVRRLLLESGGKWG
jgi:hypothetical protein